MSEHQAPTPGWWWYDMGPHGRVIPHAVLVEEYDGVLYADVGTGQKPAKPGPWWLGPVAPYQPAAAPDLARDLIATEERVAALKLVIERVRPVVEALAALADVPECGKSALAPLMTGLGRPFTPHGDDAAWLRSLLSTGTDPAHRSGHTDLMVAPESAPDLAEHEAAPTSERFTIDSPWRFE